MPRDLSDRTLPWPAPKKLVDPNRTLPPVAEYSKAPRDPKQDMNDRYGYQADMLWREFIEKAKSAEARGAAIEWTMLLLTCAAHWRRIADDRRAGEALALMDEERTFALIPLEEGS